MMEPAGTYKRTMALGIIMLMLGGALVGLFMARYGDFALNGGERGAPLKPCNSGP